MERKALFAALCSSIIPGVGQLIAKRWLRGVVLLGGVLALVGGIAWFGLRSSIDDLLSLLVQPSVLLGVLALNGAILIVRLLATFDAYALNRTQSHRTTQRWVSGILLAVLLLVTAAPHAAAGYYTYTSYELLTTLFVDDTALPAASPTPSGPVISVVASATPVPTATPAPTVTPTPPSTAAGRPVDLPADDLQSPTATPTPAPLPEAWQQVDRLNVLLIGGDAGPERKGLRTDTMMVVSVDPATKEAAIFGIPRNLKNVPLPEPAARQFACRCWPNMLNELYNFAEKNPHLFPAGDRPGAVALQATLGKMLGIEIDHYAMVDLGGFVDVVDAMGGVTMEVQTPVTIRISPAKPGEEWQVYDIPAGRQHLDGRTALAFARNRSDSDDYNRMRRQRCLISAVAREADATQLLRSFPQLARVAKERVTTDIPLSVLPDLIRLATSIDADTIRTVGFSPPRYNAGYTAEQYPIPDVPAIQHTVQTIFDQPPPDDVASSSRSPIETAAESCGWNE